MKSVAPSTFKGGVGKTQTIYNLAGIAEERGNKVLLIDNDPQGNLSNLCGVDQETAIQSGSHEIFEKRTPADQLIIKSPMLSSPGIDIIPGGMLLGRAESNLNMAPSRETVLTRWFKANRSLLDKYDLILFDVNPTMSIINQNTFTVSDSIILITEVGKNSMFGVQYFIELWGGIAHALDIPTKLDSLIVTKKRKGVRMHEDFSPYIRSLSYPVPDGTTIEIDSIIVEPSVPLNVSIQETETHGMPINRYKPESSGAVAYGQIADELIRRGVF